MKLTRTQILFLFNFFIILIYISKFAIVLFVKSWSFFLSYIQIYYIFLIQSYYTYPVHSYILYLFYFRHILYFFWFSYITLTPFTQIYYTSFQNIPPFPKLLNHFLMYVKSFSEYVFTMSEAWFSHNNKQTY